VRVPAGFDAAALRQLLPVMREEPPSRVAARERTARSDMGKPPGD
jgi:hypothetical protein